MTSFDAVRALPVSLDRLDDLARGARVLVQPSEVQALPGVATVEALLQPATWSAHPGLVRAVGRLWTEDADGVAASEAQNRRRVLVAPAQVRSPVASTGPVAMEMPQMPLATAKQPLTTMLSRWAGQDSLADPPAERDIHPSVDPSRVSDRQATDFQSRAAVPRRDRVADVHRGAEGASAQPSLPRAIGSVGTVLDAGTRPTAGKAPRFNPVPPAPLVEAETWLTVHPQQQAAAQQRLPPAASPDSTAIRTWLERLQAVSPAAPYRDGASDKHFDSTLSSSASDSGPDLAPGRPMPAVMTRTGAVLPVAGAPGLQAPSLTASAPRTALPQLTLDASLAAEASSPAVAMPGGELGRLVSWWQGQPGVLPNARPSVQPAAEAPTVVPVPVDPAPTRESPEDLSETLGRLLVAELRRHGLEVDEA